MRWPGIATELATLQHDALLLECFAAIETIASNTHDSIATAGNSQKTLKTHLEVTATACLVWPGVNRVAGRHRHRGRDLD